MLKVLSNFKPLLFTLVVALALCSFSPIEVLAGTSVSNTNTGNNGTGGTAHYKYWYEYNAEYDALVLFAQKGSSPKINMNEYYNKYHSLPTVNATRLSGVGEFGGLPVKNIDTIQKSYQGEALIALKEALLKYGDENWVFKLGGSGMPMEDGDYLLKIFLKHVAPDIELNQKPKETPKPEEAKPAPEETPQLTNYIKEEIESKIVLRGVSGTVDYKLYDTVGGEIGYNNSTEASESFSESASISSAESAFENGVPDVEIEKLKPQAYEAHIESKATYVKVFRKKTYTRHDKYETRSTTITSTNSQTGETTSYTSYYTVKVGYTPWELQSTVYYFGSSIYDDKESSYNGDVKEPEIYNSKPVDLTTHEHISAVLLSSDSPIGKYPMYDEKNIRAKVTTEFGKKKNVKFRLTSENVPACFKLKNEGWLGVTEDFGEDLVLGHQSPGGTKHKQFVNSVELYYKAYSGSDSVDRCSIQLIDKLGTVYNESTSQESIMVQNAQTAERFSELTFKERSIKYGDYLIGDEGYFCLETNIGRHNHIGYDFKVTASGSSVSHSINDLRDSYNKMVLTADFPMAYLHGEFEVLDAAGRN